MARKKHSASNPWPERLKALRTKLGKITQSEAAERIGMSLRMYQYYESGEKIPQAATAVLLEQFCRFPENF